MNVVSEEVGNKLVGLRSHRLWIEASNVGFRKMRNCKLSVKRKQRHSFKVSAQLFCISVFGYADGWFIHDPAHNSIVTHSIRN